MLLDGDIEVYAMPNASMGMANGKMVDGVEVRFRVRKETEGKIFIPWEQYSKAYAEQLMLRLAAELVDLRDQYPIRE